MPEFVPHRPVSPGLTSKGYHSPPGLKAWSFLAQLIKENFKTMRDLVSNRFPEKNHLLFFKTVSNRKRTKPDSFNKVYVSLGIPMGLLAFG